MRSPSAPGTEPAAAALTELPYRETKRHLAELDAGSALKPEPAHLLSKSEFFRRSLPADAIAALVDHLGTDRLAGCARELDFTPWGGADNRIASDATAFVHRAERFLLKHEVTVAAPQAVPRAREWLARSWALAHPAGTCGAYAELPRSGSSARGTRRTTGPMATACAGSKASYDPDGVFGAIDRR